MARVIAIDPGYEKSALVEWDGAKILDAKIVPNEEMESLLCWLDDDCTTLIEWMTNYEAHVGQEVFHTCRWVGRFEAAMRGSAVLVPRREVKMWHTGRPSTKDADVTAALKDKYGEKGTKKKPGLTYCLKADLWQAFALATYWTEIMPLGP